MSIAYNCYLQAVLHLLDDWCTRVPITSSGLSTVMTQFTQQGLANKHSQLEVCSSKENSAS